MCGQGLGPNKIQTWGGDTPWGFLVSVHLKGVEVLCFDTVLQVFILNRLRLALFGTRLSFVAHDFR